MEASALILGIAERAGFRDGVAGARVSGRRGEVCDIRGGWVVPSAGRNQACGRASGNSDVLVLAGRFPRFLGQV